MVLGKQCLMIRLSIHGCPSSSCLVIKYFQQYYKMILHRICGSGLRNSKINSPLEKWEPSFLIYRALKYIVLLFSEVLCQRIQKSLLMTSQHCTNHSGFTQGPWGGSPMEVLDSDCTDCTLNLFHFRVYVSLVTIYVKGQSMCTQR